MGAGNSWPRGPQCECPAVGESRCGGGELSPIGSSERETEAGEAGGGSCCVQLFGLWPKITCRIVTEL